MEGQLFDKHMPELREAFVRARFAQFDTFSRADFLERIANPEWTGFTRFDGCPALTVYIEEAWRGLVLDHELTFATPGVGKDDLVKRVGADQRDSFSAVLFALDPVADIYFPGVNDADAYPVAVTNGRVLRLAPSKTNDGIAMTIQKATVRDVLTIVNAEVSDRRPKAKMAAELMNCLAHNAAAVVRKAAERDFDEAIAVSIDGTKIVKANWVLVMPAGSSKTERRLCSQPPTGDTWLLYPGSAFTENKVRRQPDQRNYHSAGYASVHVSPSDEQGLKYFDLSSRRYARSEFINLLPRIFHTHRAKPNGQTQWLLEVHANFTGLPGLGKILYVDANDCPFPPPSGGQEIKT